MYFCLCLFFPFASLFRSLSSNSLAWSRLRGSGESAIWMPSAKKRVEVGERPPRSTQFPGALFSRSLFYFALYFFLFTTIWESRTGSFLPVFSLQVTHEQTKRASSRSLSRKVTAVTVCFATLTRSSLDNQFSRVFWIITKISHNSVRRWNCHEPVKRPGSG